MVQSKIQQAVGRGAPYVEVLPVPLLVNRAPASSDIMPAGALFIDTSTTPDTVYTSLGNGDFASGGNEMATTTTAGIVTITDNNDPVATKVYVDAVVVAGGPVATNTTPPGLVRLATDVKVTTPDDGGSTLANPPNVVIPSNLVAKMSAPGAIGNVTPSTGAFTTLTGTAVGSAIAFTSDTSSSFGVTGAGVDLTLSSSGGQVIVNGEEAAANAVRLLSAAGGLDVDVALLLSLTSSRNNANAIELVASAGGVDISATGTAGEDIDILATGSSVNITATENVADSIVISSTNGGIDITAAGASAGEDIDISAVGSSVNISSTENAALAISLNTNGGASETIRLRNQQGTNAGSIDLDSTAGGITLTAGLATADAINIVASNAAGGIDIDAGTGGIAIDSTGAIVATSTANSAASLFLHANGGTSETIRLHADQGTAVTSLDLLSDVGGITLRAGLATADAINITATNVGGGIDVDAGTAGFIVDTTGAVSLDSALASNVTVTGVADLTLSSVGGSVVITGTEAAVDAIQLNATTALGGIDVNAGTGGMTVDSGGILSLDAAGIVNLTTTGAFDITVNSTAGSVILTGAEAAVDAVQINATTAGGGVDINAGSGGVTVDTTAAISLDSATASNFTVTGAADLTLASSAGAVNITSGEANADSLNMTSGGGFSLVATGAAAKDVIITSTSGSMTLSAGENVSDAMNFTAGGGASGITLTAGTSGITFASGQIVKVTSVAAAATPYALLGTDYFVTTDTTGGVLTVTLPAAPTTGKSIVVYDGVGQAAANNVTIDGNGKSIAFAGTAAGTKLLNTAYESATLVYNGTLWCARDVI